MDSQSVIDKHAKRFIVATHAKESIRGITFDELGNAWATDGIQLLQVMGLTPCEPVEVRDLKGKKLKVTPLPSSTFNGLVREIDFSARLNVKGFLAHAALMQSVLKVARADLVRLVAENGELSITIDEKDIVKGSSVLGDSADLNIYVSAKRLVSCLQVFDGYADKVVLRVKGHHMLQLTAGNVVVVLMGVRKS